MSEQGSHLLTVDEWLRIFNLEVLMFKEIVIQGKVVHDTHVSKEVEKNYHKLQEEYMDKLIEKIDFYENVYKEKLPNEEIPPYPPGLTTWEVLAKKMLVQLDFISEIVPLDNLLSEEKDKIIASLKETASKLDLEGDESRNEKKQGDKLSSSNICKLALLGCVIVIIEEIIKKFETLDYPFVNEETLNI